MQNLRQRRWDWVLPGGWAHSLGLAIAVGIAYFLTARLGFALLTRPDDVAVFWPASGISVGILLALGPKARWPVIFGIMAASVVANLMGDRNLAATVVFTLCNVGETILIAELIARRFGPQFSIDQVRNVLGLIAATAVGSAVSGVGGAMGIILFHNSGAPFLTTWWNWFASVAVGVISIAPLMIGLTGLWRERPTGFEVAEGLLLLAVLALISTVGLAWPEDYWFTILPGTLVAPLLLYLAARCRPLLSVAAACIIALVIVSTLTFGLGRLGDSSIILATRVYAAQTAVLALCGCILVLSALFAERRHHVRSLENSNRRLQLALDCAELGTWSLDLKSRRFENDARDRRIHGHELSAPPRTLAQARAHVHPEDLRLLDHTFAGSELAGGPCRTEYRLRAESEKDTGRQRWVAIEGAIVRDADGRPVELLGVTCDITERKHVEASLRESERSLRDLLGALPAAIYVADAAGRITYCNDAAVKLWGAKPRLGQDRSSDLSRFYHPDGTPIAPEDCPTAIALQQGRIVRGREAILERRDGSRVPIAPYPTPLRDRTGAVVGIVNMTVDISERKQAEQILAERNAQLVLAGEFALVGTFTFEVGAGRMQVSPGYVAIHGLPEGTEEINRHYWRGGVHPDDLPGVEAGLKQAVAARRREFYCEYRIVRAGGEVRWIDSRNLISYDGDGGARLIGANIDVTQRKQTEAALAAHKASLADALTAGRVMAFDWDALTRRSRRSDNAMAILGVEHGPEAISTRDAFFRYVHLDDRCRFKAKVRDLSPSNPSYALTFRFCPPNGAPIWLEETAKGEFDAAGRLLRIKGLTRNITERKEAELVLEERNIQVALAEKATLVGSFAYDADTEIMQISEGYVAIHGFPEGTTEIPRSQCLADVHCDDIGRVEQSRSQCFAARRREYSVEYRIARPDGEERWVETRCFISYDGDRPQRVLGVSIDITGRKRAEDHQRTLTAELDHRVKNVLSTVVAIIGQTQEGHGSLSDFAAALDRRIKALAQTHELLSQSRWSGVSLRDIARRELAPYKAGNVEIGGPHVTLTAEAAQAIAMVLHELTTNAAKHGALSHRGGRVQLRWWGLRNGSSGRLAIRWQEMGGSAVQAPHRTGYGTSVIRELIPFELDGKVDLDFAPEGVRCRVEIPKECIGIGSRETAAEVGM